MPSYLKPETQGATAAVVAVKARFRPQGGKRRKLYGSQGKHAKNQRDPLRSFRGAGKKSGKKTGPAGGGKKKMSG